MKIKYKETNPKFNAIISELRKNKKEIILDSRKVNEGSIFVSLPILSKNMKKEELESQQVEYMKSAAKSHAAHIICEKDIADKFIKELPVAQHLIVSVKDVRLALGKLAYTVYDSKKNNFKLIGITGTNGKTTLAFLMNYFLTEMQKKVAMLGTIEYSYPNFKMEAPLTTPDCLFLHSFFHDAQKENCDYAIMEVSSHALDQNRVAGLDFNTAIFTNLTQDHLDYHNDMDEYFLAKAKLFEMADRQIINADAVYGQKLLEKYPYALTFSLAEEHRGNDQKTLFGKILSSSPNGLELRIQFKNQTLLLNSLLIGQHNASNILAVIAFALVHNFTLEDCLCLQNFTGVPGRLERVLNSENIHAFVDYAHTPDALVNVLQALRQAGFEKIVTVFGCGGDRDRTKRKPMAEAVSSLSDIAIMTSDNPRTENPEQILDDVEQGIDKTKEYHRFIDRKEAIHFAYNLIKEKENKETTVLLIAGKGHEDYQIIGKEKFPFSDQEIVRAL